MGFISVLCVASSLSLIIITISAEDNLGAPASCEANFVKVSNILQRTQEMMTTSLQGGCSDDMQQIRDDVDRLKNQLERQQQEILLCQQQVVATLQSQVSLEGRQIELDKEKIWESLATLNQTINNHSRQTELDKEEIWESLATLNQTINNPVKCSEGKHSVNDNCTISVCLQGRLRPYQGTRAANVTFEDLVAQECIHLERTRRTWDDARGNCQDRDGDLYVAGDLAGALQYIKEQLNNRLIWAGMRGRAWTDSRTVAQQEWLSGQPDGAADDCGYIYSRDDYYRGVGDYPCTNTQPSICQKGVKYN